MRWWLWNHCGMVIAVCFHYLQGPLVSLTLPEIWLFKGLWTASQMDSIQSMCFTPHDDGKFAARCNCDKHFNIYFLSLQDSQRLWQRPGDSKMYGCVQQSSWAMCWEHRVDYLPSSTCHSCMYAWQCKKSPYKICTTTPLIRPVWELLTAEIAFKHCVFFIQKELTYCS